VLARRTTLRHPSGATVDLPRLVPSFSSKGFPFFKDKKTKKELSESTRALELIGPFITDSILVSAYDIYYGYLQGLPQLYRGKELVFIDSGGYELSPAYDSTEPIQVPRKVPGFSCADYTAVLRQLSKRLPFVISNFDWETRKEPIEDQVIAAQRLFNDFPRFLHNFIIKPGGNNRYLDVDEAIRHAKKLRRFHILGITEKELGKNLLDRLSNLAKLRAAMDREDIHIPIHVWGGLDPVLTPLYFFVGAEIFDGVSWLRYAYYDGMAVYRDLYGVLELGIETSLDHARALTLNHNTTVLSRLTTSLREFVDQDGIEFSMFGSQAKTLEKAYRTLGTKVSELRGGLR
jgi:hypothetical protein